MKIISTTKRNGVLCYVQVKDVMFLARITKNHKMMEQYVKLINNGKGDDDFIRVTQTSLIDLFTRCDHIINFSDFANKDSNLTYLSNLLVNMNTTLVGGDLEKECIQHKSDDIRDIMSFKKRELDYKIPLVPSGVVEYTNDEGNLYFDSTVVEDCFILTTKDGSPVQNHDYYDFYVLCMKRIFSELYPDREFNSESYNCYDRVNMLVITVNREKKKTNVVNRILSKIKKGS